MGFRNSFPLIVLLSIFCLAAPRVLAQELESDVLANNVLILDLKRNKTLFEKNAEQKVPIASLTKLMLTLLVLEKIDLNDLVIISQNAANTSGSTAQLKAGEHLKVQDLLYALLLPSGNDAAMALAEALSGSQANAVSLMNDRARELFLENTYYSNAVGFDLGGGYSSATDLSTLTKQLLTHDLFRQIIQTPQTSLTSSEGYSRNILNTNQLLGVTVAGLTVTGMKTGTTPEAGECLIILAQDEKGNEVLITLLGSPDRYLDGRHLLMWVGENIELGKPDEPLLPSLPQWPFTDMPANHPYFFQTLLNFKNQTIITGDGITGLLRPEDPLNRAEMVTILLRAQGYDLPEEIQACAELMGESANSGFSDVALESWYAPSIRCAHNLGWISGDDLPAEALPGTLPNFRPSDPLALTEAVKLIVRSEQGIPPPNLNGSTWYDLYFNYLLAGNIIEKDAIKNEYYLTQTDYNLGALAKSISRIGAFELLHRLMNSQVQEDYVAHYQPFLSLDDYEATGAMLTFQNNFLSINDPHLHFQISGIPLENLDLSQLQFQIQAPSGASSDYYTQWNLLYPEPSNLTSTQKMKTLVSVIIYDPDYLTAGYPPEFSENFIIGESYNFQLSQAAKGIIIEEL